MKSDIFRGISTKLCDFSVKILISRFSNQKYQKFNSSKKSPKNGDQIRVFKLISYSVLRIWPWYWWKHLIITNCVLYLFANVEKRPKSLNNFLKPIMFKTNSKSCDIKQCLKHDFYLTLSNGPFVNYIIPKLCFSIYFKL